MKFKKQTKNFFIIEENYRNSNIISHIYGKGGMDSEVNMITMVFL